MTRDQAEELARTGAARWDGSALVLLWCGPPLMHRGRPVELETPAEPSRVSWPGWTRAEDGTWSAVSP